MTRVRVSTTVDEALLTAARKSLDGASDSAVVDEALRALLAINRRTEIDAAYAAYDGCPVDTPDDWGDLASFHNAAAKSHA